MKLHFLRLAGTGLIRPFGEFGKAAVQQTFGTVISQIIPILIAPLITRLFTAEDFGLYAVILSISTMLGVVAGWRLDHGIMVAMDAHAAKRVASVALILALPTCVFFSVIAVVVLWLRGVSDPAIWAVWGLIAPVIGYLTLMSRSLVLLNNRETNFRLVARARVLQATVVAVSSILFGVVSSNSYGLILALVLGFGVSNYVLWLRLPMLEALNYPVIIATLRNNKNFVKFSLPADLVSIASSRMPFIVFPALFGLEQTGFLALAYRVVATPSRFVGSAIGEVFYAHAARTYERTGECWTLTKNVALALSALGFLCFSILFLISQKLFIFAFGAEWSQAGYFVQALAPMLLFGFVVSPVSVVLYVASRQKIDLIWQVAYFSATTAACFTGVWIGGAVGSLFAYSTVGCLLYSVYFVLIRHASKGSSVASTAEVG